VTGAISKLRTFVINTLLASPLVPSAIRVRGLRLCGVSVPDSARVHPQCYFSTTRVSIGEDSFVNTRCFFESHDTITIGDRVSLAMEVLLCTPSHHVGPPAERAGPSFMGPIVIGDGCWLGARSTVLTGVTIGPGCVIAAGALVTSNCAADGLYVGVPARRVKDLERTPVQTDGAA
jgi:maltose O-acetyltransferase